MLEVPASTWIPIASPYSLWKEALAHGITCLLKASSQLQAQGTGSIVGALASSRNTLISCSYLGG